MTKLRKKDSLISAASLVGTLITIVMLFLSAESRNILIENAILGWTLLALLMIAGPIIISCISHANREKSENRFGEKVTELSRYWQAEVSTMKSNWEIREAELESTWKAKIDALSREDWARDLPLLAERMVDWELKSVAYKYLVEIVTHLTLPKFFVNVLDETLEAWNRDTRELSDPHVIEAWNHCRDSVHKYQRAINEHMFWKETEDLEIPPEWRYENAQRYFNAINELEVTRNALRDSLGKLHKIQHSLSSTLTTVR